MTVAMPVAVQLFNEAVCTCHTMWYLNISTMMRFDSPQTFLNLDSQSGDDVFELK